MDRLEAMTLLVAAVEAGSFSAASRKLGVPLPTLSRKVADLERHLKTRLLVRSTRKLALTEGGEAYLAACKRILEQVSDAERTVTGEYAAPKGDLILTAPIVFGRLHVLPILNRFLARFPEINVRLVLSDRNVHLVDDHIDIAVRIGDLPDSRMIATRVGFVGRTVCGSPDLLAARGTPKTPADLTDYPCVTFDAGTGATWTFASLGHKGIQMVPVRSRLSVNTAEAAVDAAVAGVGLTQVLSYQAARAVHDGALTPVLKRFERAPIPVSLIYAAQGPLPLKTRSFLEFVAPSLRRALAGIGLSSSEV